MHASAFWIFNAPSELSMRFLNLQCPFWFFNAPSELSRPFLNLQCPFWIFNTPCESSLPFLNLQCPFWIFNTPCESSLPFLNLQCPFWIFNTPCESSLPFLNLQCPFWIFNTPSNSSMPPFEASSNDAFIRQFNISPFEHPSPHTDRSIQFNRIIFQAYGSDLLFVCSRHCEIERWNLANRWQQAAQLCRRVATDLESSVCSTDCHCCLC